MMVVHVESGRVEHRRVRDLPEYLEPSDSVVVNRTRVTPARIVGRRVGDGRETEGLCLQPTGPSTWSAMLRGAKRFKVGDEVALVPPEDAGLTGVLAKALLPKQRFGQNPGEDRVRVVERTPEGVVLEFLTGEPAEVLARSGWTPLPPYIVSARRESAPDADDRAWYQTVYAAEETRPSVAAPTAGLHFTPELLARVRGAVAAVLEVELQVGSGTFKPVTCDDVRDHPMHSEWCAVPPETVRGLKAAAGRVMAVGTTSARVLESLPRPLEGGASGLAFDTRLLLAPGATFRWVDVLMTNFHLPGSTLLALVGAFAGLDRVHELYALAQREGYRFYSYGDAMLLLRASR